MNNERSPHMNWTQVCLSLVFIVATCSYAELAGAKSEYEVIHTGIQGGGCWSDDTHFVMVRGQQPAPGQEFEVEGLYYLDPAKPKDLRKIDLAPIEPSFQMQIRDVTCQSQTVMFHVLSADKKRNKLYSLKIGQPPALLAEKHEGFVVPQAVSITNRFVLSFSSIFRGRDLQSSPLLGQSKNDCGFVYLQPGYRVACLPHDRGTKRTWLLRNAFLVEYLWDETIRVSKDGGYQWVTNPESPLRLPDGSEVRQGYLVRDLNNRIIHRIPTQQGSYKMDRASFQSSSAGIYLYARCSKVGDYDPPRTFFGRICRFNLGNNETQWKEVFSVQREPNERASLYDLDVNDQGDVVVMRRAHRVRPTLWKYTAQRASVEQLPAGQLSQEIGAVRIAPDGRTISYLDKGQLVLLRSQEGKP